jgi:hypothetical protein
MKYQIVRSGPFHGGESGSIPLGSANAFNGLASTLPAVSNECPINGYRRLCTMKRAVAVK